jgi:RNA polymerase sigma-70 factor (ECF subfamily)
MAATVITAAIIALRIEKFIFIRLRSFLEFSKASLDSLHQVSANGLQFLTCICDNSVALVPSAAPIGMEFLDRLRRRDPNALAEAVREHARPLMRAARAMGFPAHEAEDLVQDVYTTFLERIAGFEARSQLRTWLFGILHKKMLERRRASSIEHRSDPVDQVFESRFDANGKWANPPADLERLLLSKEVGELIHLCLEELPANQRGAFVLREVEGVASGEICKILNLSVTNFGVLMHRARTRLRECLEAKGWSKR